MATYYVDSNHTGVANSGAGDGSLSDPFVGINDVATYATLAAGDVVSIAENSVFYLDDGSEFNLDTNITSGVHCLYKCTVEGGDWLKKPVIYAAKRYDNNASYNWVSSGINNEWYLTSPTGTNPNVVEPKSGTIDGYYRGSSCNDNNSAKEQRATDIASGNDQVIESMSALCWGYGAGAVTSLGYNTIWFKPEDGKTPNDYEILLSNNDRVLNSNRAGYDFQDLIFSHGNSENVRGRQNDTRIFIRCGLVNADFTCIDTGSTQSSMINKFYSCLFSQSHRVSAMNHAIGGVDIYNCVAHNIHITVLNSGSLTNTINFKNNIVIDGESGITDINSNTTFNEANNIFYQRHNAANDASKILRYVTDSSDWPTSSATTIPKSLSTSTVLSQQALRNPSIVKSYIHDWKKCDFRLLENSPAIGAGLAISDVPTDGYGELFSITNPNIGMYAGNGLVKYGEQSDNCVIMSTNEQKDSVSIKLDAGQNINVKTFPELRADESVSGSIDGGSIGTVVNGGESEGFVKNTKNYTVTLILTKSATNDLVRVEVD